MYVFISSNYFMLHSEETEEKQDTNENQELEEEYVIEEEEFDEEEQDPNVLFNYRFLNEIARGSCGQVFLVEDIKTKKLYAAKAYPRSQLLRVELDDRPSKMERFTNELQILASMDHPNIIKIIEVIDDDVTSKIYIFLPYAEKGTLAEWNAQHKPLNEDQLRPLMKQVAEGLSYLHEHNVVHRDLKPENILLLDEHTAVISDFTCSTQLKSPDQRLDDSEGTPAYCAPEEETGELFDGRKSDVWSYGITLYVMIFGQLPFKTRFDVGNYFTQCTQIADEILNGTISFDKDPPISNELMELFNALLCKDPNKRVTMADALKMKWFNM